MSVGNRSSRGHEVYGRNNGKLVGLVPMPDPPALEECGAGYAYIVNGYWPRTSPDFLPQTLPVDVDLDGDGQIDARATVLISVVDENHNGVVDAGDRVCLSPIACRIVGHGTRLILSEAANREICRKVANAL